MVGDKKINRIIDPQDSGAHVTITFQKQGIYYVQLDDNELFTMDFFPFSLQFRNKHPELQPKLLLFEYGRFSGVDATAREYAAQRQNSPFTAEAYVVKNLAQRLLTKYYARIMNSRGIRVQLFDDYASARAWLLSLV